LHAITGIYATLKSAGRKAANPSDGGFFFLSRYDPLRLPFLSRGKQPPARRERPLIFCKSLIQLNDSKQKANTSGRTFFRL
jgi:hypothetical protein